MLVGDPDKGLVGLGKGSSQEGMLARNQAFAKGVEMRYSPHQMLTTL